MRRLHALTALATLTTLAGCSAVQPGYTPPPSSQSAIAAVLGTPAATAYMPSEVIGGRGARAQRIVRAGIRPVATAGVGDYVGRLEAELRAQTAGTGIDMMRRGNELLLRMPSGITFDSGSSTLAPEFQATLAEIARSLQEFRATMIDVLGHTDATGSDALNQRLSTRRAEAVASYLSSREIAKARMETRGYGETMPIASNTTEAGRAANRRVEIKLVPVTQADVD